MLITFSRVSIIDVLTLTEKKTANYCSQICVQLLEWSGKAAEVEGNGTSLMTATVNRVSRS